MPISTAITIIGPPHRHTAILHLKELATKKNRHLVNVGQKHSFHQSRATRIEPTYNLIGPSHMVELKL